MANILIDGDFTVATPVGPYRLSSPIPAVNANYLLEQEYWQLFGSFAPTALGTPHPAMTSYYLVAESPWTPVGNGVIRWNRTYARVPDSYVEPDLYSYSFVGFAMPMAGNVVVRGRHTATVPSRVYHDFFLVDPNSAQDLSIPRYTSDSNIPRILALHYCVQWTASSVTMGGYHADTDTLLSPTTNVFATLPTPETYAAMLKDAHDNSWNATKTVQVLKTGTVGSMPVTLVDSDNTVYGGLIPAEDSKLTRWMGPIFDRQTRYVLAE